MLVLKFIEDVILWVICIFMYPVSSMFLDSKMDRLMCSWFFVLGISIINALLRRMIVSALILCSSIMFSGMFLELVALSLIGGEDR